MVQHGYKLDEDQQGESENEHEAQRINVHVLSGVLQVDVDLGHLDEERIYELETEGRYEPEGVADEVDEGNLYMRRKKRD